GPLPARASRLAGCRRGGGTPAPRWPVRRQPAGADVHRAGGAAEAVRHHVPAEEMAVPGVAPGADDEQLGAGAALHQDLRRVAAFHRVPERNVGAARKFTANGHLEPGKPGYLGTWARVRRDDVNEFD